MRLQTEQHPVMLAEVNFNTEAAREKAVRILFEKYNVPGAPAVAGHGCAPAGLLACSGPHRRAPAVPCTPPQPSS